MVGLGYFIHIMKLNITKSKRKQPTIVVVGCLHGDETVGYKVIKELQKLKIIKGQLKTIIGNDRAFIFNTRFIDKDLNRSFPGNKKSEYFEERRASEIIEVISSSDYVIDIHSTTSDSKDVIIIKKKNTIINKMISVINPSKVVLMPKNFGDGSLIKFCSGISMEYGKNNKGTFTKSLNDIKRLMSNLGMIEDNSSKIINKTKFYEIFGTEIKPKGFKLSKLIHNFNIVSKSSVIGQVGNKTIRAKETFYPVLFGEKAYKDIIGFKARKLR